MCILSLGPFLYSFSAVMDNIIFITLSLETFSLSLFAMNVILINFIFMKNIPESSHSAGVKLAKCVKIV